MPSITALPTNVTVVASIPITGLAVATIVAASVVWTPPIQAGATVFPTTVGAVSAVALARPSGGSVTFGVTTVAGKGWLVPFIARDVAAITAQPATLVTVPLVPDDLAMAVSDVPLPSVFSPHDTWRPRVKPGGLVLLASRTNPGDHDVTLTETTLWAFDPDGFDGILDGTTDRMVVGPPADNGWVTYGHPEWDTAGDQLVIFAETVSDWQIVLLDGEDFSILSTVYTASKPDVATDPSFSPNDDLLFVERISGVYKISRQSLGATPNYEQLVSSSNLLADPTVSPNGNYVLYAEMTGAVSGPHPYGQWSIKTMKLSNSAVTTVHAGGDANLHPTWYDNNNVLFQTFRYAATPDTAFQIVKMKRNGSEFTVLGQGEYPQAVRI